MENTKEIWTGAKTFDQDYTGLYKVSNMGRCWSIKSQKFIGRWNKGYFYVCLCKDGKAENMQVGRLMLMSFDIPIPDHLKDLPTNKIQASHIDEDKTHNYLWNLCWESPKENCGRDLRRQRCSKAQKGKHMSEESRQKMSKSHKGKHLGKEHYRSKPVLQCTKDGELIREWECIRDAEIELGIWNQNITHCCKRKYGYKTAGGFIWRYKNEDPN